MKSLKNILTVFSVFVSIVLGNQNLLAQNAEWQHIEGGNKLFKQKKFNAAEIEYKKALKANPANARAYFNLGNAKLAQDSDSVALEKYNDAIRLETSKINRSMAYQNRGVIFQSRAGASTNETVRQRMLRLAINEYKHALRENPQAEASRYNLALCQKQLRDSEQKKEQQEQQPQQKEKEQKLQPQNQPLINYARQADRKAREKINASQQQKRLEKNW